MSGKVLIFSQIENRFFSETCVFGPSRRERIFELVSKFRVCKNPMCSDFARKGIFELGSSGQSGQSIRTGLKKRVYEGFCSCTCHGLESSGICRNGIGDFRCDDLFQPSLYITMREALTFLLSLVLKKKCQRTVLVE